jgi:hypothetical protein
MAMKPADDALRYFGSLYRSQRDGYPERIEAITFGLVQARLMWKTAGRYARRQWKKSANSSSARSTATSRRPFLRSQIQS